MTRASMLLWSTVTGFIVGLLVGITVLAALTLAVSIVPGVPERLVDRLRTPVVALLLGVVPVVAAVVGYLEGRAKVP